MYQLRNENLYYKTLINVTVVALPWRIVFLCPFSNMTVQNMGRSFVIQNSILNDVDVSLTAK